MNAVGKACDPIHLQANGASSDVHEQFVICGSETDAHNIRGILPYTHHSKERINQERARERER